jgi:hypothetical protein
VVAETPPTGDRQRRRPGSRGTGSGGLVVAESPYAVPASPELGGGEGPLPAEGLPRQIVARRLVHDLDDNE